MRCAWSAGFMVGLEEIGLIPKVIITRSGNAGSAVYLATHQSESIKRIWTKHLPGTRFIRWWRPHKIIDVDYLVDTVFVTKEPMMFEVLKESPVRVYIACFNLTQQRIDYFDNKTISLDVLKATKALPIVYGKEITIGKSQYADHIFPLQNLIEDQRENMEGKIIVVDVRQKSGFFPIVYKMICGKKIVFEVVNKNILTIRPENLNAHLLSNSQNVLKKHLTKDISMRFLKKMNYAHI